jgi:glycolate oxidase iron-sulfur subunit
MDLGVKRQRNRRWRLPPFHESGTDAIQTWSSAVNDPMAQSGTDDGTREESTSAWTNVYRAAFRDCVNCGLCVNVCPTYLETGNESDSPRGRIRLMQAVVEERLDLNGQVQHHLDLCTQCRACEATCPYEVKYGQLLWSFRQTAQSGIAPRKTPGFEQRTVPHVFSRPERLRRWLRPTRFAQRFRIDRMLMASGLWRVMPGR